MMSRPNFEVDIVKSNGKTLSFTCTYVHPEEMAQEGEGPGKPPPPFINLDCLDRDNDWTKCRDKKSKELSLCHKL